MSAPTAPQETPTYPAVTTPGGGVTRRPYYRPPSRLWFMQSRAYFLFLVRELTSLFVAAYALFLLYAVWRIGQGPEAYGAMLELLRAPGMVALHLVVLAFALYHTITWFNLTPKIMVVRLGEEQLPPVLVAAAVYAGWLVVTVAMLWLVLRG